MNENKEELTEEIESVNEQAEEIQGEVDENSFEEQTLKLVQENQELKDKLLRQIAETENVRVRNLKIVKDAKDYAVTEFARDMIVVMDNLSRALEHLPAEMDDNVKNILQGVKMTHSSLEQTFKKHGIDLIAPKKGDKFDYTQHNAISQFEAEDFGPDLIFDVVQSGYQLKDRLLRPASVVVTK